jgi:hypothetical protein
MSQGGLGGKTKGERSHSVLRQFWDQDQFSSCLVKP